MIKEKGRQERREGEGMEWMDGWGFMTITVTYDYIHAQLG